MTWYPMAFLPPQYDDTTGKPYSGAVLKAYRAETNTNIPMATSSDGSTTVQSFVLNAAGYPTSGGMVIIPHVQENYKIALYPTQAAADANSGAVWTYDEISIAGATNTPFYQEFSADGITGAYVLSTSMGTDEKALMVFADKKFSEYVSNGTFDTDTVWTKGAGWVIGSGVATATLASSDLSQTSSLTPIIAEESYTITYTITRTAGDVTPKIGGRAGTTRNAAGTYTETIIAGATQAIAFTGAAFSGTVDVVTIHRTTAVRREIVSPNEYTLNGVNLTLNFNPAAGTNNVLVFSPSQLFGALGDLVAAAAISEANASDSADEAAASAVDAANYAAGLKGTSTTSVLIGTGTKSFVTQADKQFQVGNFITLASAANVANVMWGQVTAYNSGTGALDVNVTSTGGAGTFADWLIGISGQRGLTGGPVSDGTYGSIDVTGGGTIWTPVVASQSEAEAGTNNTKTITPLRALQSNKGNMPWGYKAGLILSNNVTDANNDIDISPGECVDTGNLLSIRLDSILVKRLDALWAVGTNQGGLDTGSKANSTWYHLWAIKRPDTGVVDALFSTSAITPTMPTNYTLKRRLGSVLTDGSGNIRGFRQIGNRFDWTNAVLDINVTNPGTSPVLRQLTVPPGIKTEALINLGLNNTSASFAYLLSDPDMTRVAPSLSVAPLGSLGIAGSVTTPVSQVSCVTNTNREIRTEASASGASNVVVAATYAWREFF